MVLASKIKFLRRKIGLSQMELAEKLGVSRQAISSWEAGASRPSVDNLQCLSKLYNIPLEVLLDDTAEAEPLAETPVNKAVDVQKFCMECEKESSWYSGLFNCVGSHYRDDNYIKKYWRGNGY